MKNILIVLLFTNFIGNAQSGKENAFSQAENVLDAWHKAAAAAKFDEYFSLMTPTSVFIGTDHTEKWNIDQFKAFTKPHFDKGNGWDFKSFDREIKNLDASTIWFDELLDTWMGICRGSGLMLKQKDGSWKIDRYVLSMSIPNDNAVEIAKLKFAIEDKFLKEQKVRK